MDTELKQADIQTSKHLDSKPPKSKDASYVRTTMYLTGDTHKRLKDASYRRADGMDMSDIADAAIARWLDQNV